jgi:hypothetical protein
MTTKLPNGHNIYQRAKNYSKWPKHILTFSIQRSFLNISQLFFWYENKPICQPCWQGPSSNQGCQMVYFRTQNPNSVKFLGSCSGRGWHVLWTLGVFYGHLV